MIYAPELVSSALSIEPIGEPVASATECCMCGSPIAEGELGTPFKAQVGFMDGRQLLGNGRTVCGHCSAQRSKTNMLALQKFCATEDKVWKLYSGVNRAWMLRNLPEKPFVFCISDSKIQHLIWRTPVSMSPDFFRIRYGNRIFDIRRQAIFAAADLSEKMVKALASHVPEDSKEGKKAKKPKRITHIPKHPFVTVDGSLESSNFGVIRSDFIGHESKEVSSLVRRVRDLNLSVGEIWLTGILCNYQPEEPDLIKIS